MYRSNDMLRRGSTAWSSKTANHTRPRKLLIWRCKMRSSSALIGCLFALLSIKLFWGWTRDAHVGCTTNVPIKFEPVPVSTRYLKLFMHSAYRLTLTNVWQVCSCEQFYFRAWKCSWQRRWGRYLLLSCRISLYNKYFYLFAFLRRVLTISSSTTCQAAKASEAPDRASTFNILK